MEKYCQRREGINQRGCMLVFINIFGSNHKHLLMAKKHGSKGDNERKKKQLVCSCECVQTLIYEDVTKVCKNHSANESEEKFKEIMKRLITQKEGEIKTCKDLLEAFHVLDSEEESFLKNKKKIVVEEEEKPQVVPRQEAVGLHKKCSFFGRKRRPEERRNRRAFSCFLVGLVKRRLQSSIDKKSQNRCVQEEMQSNVSDEEESSCDRKKIMSGLYIAAKKHLSEMLANGDIDVNLPDKEVPRILGKILSLPEFSSPPDSPRLTPTNGLVSHQTTEEPKILQCGSGDMINEDTCRDDETLFTIDVSLPNEKTEIDPLSECKEAATNVQGKLSPVSVLEPLFTYDENSPTTSTRRFSSGSAEMRILQPLCIRFDEADSPKPDKGNNIETGMDEKELTLAYIEAVVKSSGLSWEELLTRSLYSNKLLETELMDEVVFCSTKLCDDKSLLDDCINEVLMDFCVNDLNPGPWVKPVVQLAADVELTAKVAQEGVYWHLLPLPYPHTLDQIVSKDMAKTGSWMDLRFDIGCIGSATSEMILDELLEDVIRSCIDMVSS